MMVMVMVKILMVEKKECKCRVELGRGAITLPAVAICLLFTDLHLHNLYRDHLLLYLHLLDPIFCNFITYSGTSFATFYL